MINKNSVIKFFDSLASSWDADMIIDEKVVNQILDNAEVKEGTSVLDVACGTGVLIPFYLKRNVKEVEGIDISNKMIEIANNKYNESNVSFVCKDIHDYHPNKKFDVIMIYNAYPHLSETSELIKRLKDLLNDGGRLCISHGMSREQINKHHDRVPKEVSNALTSIEDLKKKFEDTYEIKTLIENEYMYQIVGIKK